MELRQGKHPTLSVAFTVSTLSSLYPFSLSRQSSSDQRTGKRLQTHWPMRVTVIPIDFFPLSLSLAVSTIQFLPSCVSLSSFLLCTEREKEGKSFFSWRKRGKNSSLFFFFQREREREGEKRKRLERRNRARNTSSSWHVESKERFRGLNPGCNKVHQARYLATVIGLRCHESYVIILCGTWEAAVRGFPDWREKERERDQLVKAFFPLVPLRLRGESLICMIDGTRLHDRTHPIVLQSLNWMFNVVDFLWGRRTECCRWSLSFFFLVVDGTRGLRNDFNRAN